MQEHNHHQDLELLLSLGIWPGQPQQAVIVLSDPTLMVPTFVGLLADMGHTVVLPRLSLAGAGCYSDDPTTIVIETSPNIPYFSKNDWQNLEATALRPLGIAVFDHIICAGHWTKGNLFLVVDQWTAALREGRTDRLTFEMLRASTTSWTEAVAEYSQLLNCETRRVNGIAIDPTGTTCVGSFVRAGTLRAEFAALFGARYKEEISYLLRRAQQLGAVEGEDADAAFAADDRLFATAVTTQPSETHIETFGMESEAINEE